MQDHKLVEIYTDGSCKYNPGPGGWGAVLIYRGHTKEIYGAAEATTNQRMEITAAIEALQALKVPCKVKLYSDSQYLIRSMSDWIQRWQKSGWRNSQRKPVENRDLWEKLLEVSGRHQVEWIWVQGHAGHPLQERANELAQIAAEAKLAKAI